MRKVTFACKFIKKYSYFCVMFKEIQYYDPGYIIVFQLCSHMGGSMLKRPGENTRLAKESRLFKRPQSIKTTFCISPNV